MKILIFSFIVTISIIKSSLNNFLCINDYSFLYSYNKCFNIFEEDVFKFFKIITPKKVVGKNFIRLGKKYNTGYILVDDFNFKEKKIAYSFGIGNDTSWEIGMAIQGFDVYMYDHITKKFPKKHHNFHFFKLGICEKEGKNKNLKTLEYFINKNKHKTLSNIILKIDVKPNEWDIFDKLRKETQKKFSQIIVKFHNICHFLSDPKLNEKIFRVLNKLNKTHQIIYVNGKNTCQFLITKNFNLPNVLEVSFLRKKGNKFVEYLNYCPLIDLNFPNVKNLQIPLGYIEIF